MPRQFLPQKSGPHRIACIALYRALLSQCSRLELPASSFRGPTNPIKHLIRKQFRRNKHEISARLVVAALKVGYDAEELLHSAANGDQVSYSRVLRLVAEAQSQGDADRARDMSNPPPHRPQPRKPEPYPGAPKMVESRPRAASALTGRRRIPVLVSANNLPFLRLKKPQPAFLSRVLSEKRKQKQRQINRLGMLDESTIWAAAEGRWEQLVRVKPDAVPWEGDLCRVRQEVSDNIGRGDARARNLAKRMLGIVQEETRLAEEERKARKRERGRRRRREKKGGGHSSEGTNAVAKDTTP